MKYVHRYQLVSRSCMLHTATVEQPKFHLGINNTQSGQSFPHQPYTISSLHFLNYSIVIFHPIISHSHILYPIHITFYPTPSIIFLPILFLSFVSYPFPLKYYPIQHHPIPQNPIQHGHIPTIIFHSVVFHPAVSNQSNHN